jgi:biotin synthase
MLDVEHVIASAKKAKELGSTRFCMGAAWREVKEGPAFDRVVDMVKGVKDLGLEACVTLGMLNESQAKRLADAGLDAHNHNLDTSRENYRSIIRTRTFDDRLRTLENVRKAGITVCSGGIIGMGESTDDRCEMLRTLANLEPQPESVPVNALVPVEGTPLAAMPPVDPLDLVRMIAVARILMPKTRVRLSAGRTALSREAQMLCMLAGANSIFFGEKLLHRLGARHHRHVVRAVCHHRHQPPPGLPPRRVAHVLSDVGGHPDVRRQLRHLPHAFPLVHAGAADLRDGGTQGRPPAG